MALSRKDNLNLITARFYSSSSPLRRPRAQPPTTASPLKTSKRA
ncbi:hypothetical protein SLEP1_g18809 [Rubroshorea leprosula]|uniref:Uncharacterized protein n=1 Tax=Rubroshorea leprosula TaxID=152421 RepID=A0AAV5IYR4_9ROSI|nr:hypothetical protein SLEP1_g18809 [Rubroshorea leprosula]